MVKKKMRCLCKVVEPRESELKEILKKLRERTNINYSLLFTEDGLLITVENGSFTYDNSYFESLAAISAGILSLSEQGISLLFNNDRVVNQVSIQAGHQIDKDGFEIILEYVANNIILGIVFPNNLNIGIIQFELAQIIKKLSSYFLTLENDMTEKSVKILP